MASLTSPIIVLILTFVASAQGACDDPEVLCVDSISPSSGSTAGSTRVTITGTGFLPRSLLEHFENRVVLRSSTTTESEEYACIIHKDGCMETQVMCYTEPLNDEEYLEYSVHVYSASGVELGSSFMCGGDLSSCSFSTSADATPSITALSETFMPPHSELHFEGDLYTDVYASNEHAESTADNPIITRVWVSHSSLCELRANDGTDDNILLSVDEETHYGNAACIPRGTYVGAQNVTFIIRQDAENGYGRSRKTPQSKVVMHNNQIGMVQTYAVVDSVSPSNCGSNGGCEVTISGQFFDDTTAEPQVEVGGVNCVSANSDHASISEDATEITCQVPAAPGNSVKAGNRGIVWQRWETNDIVAASLADDSTLYEENADYLHKLLATRTYDSDAGPWETGRLSAMWEVPQNNRFKFSTTTDSTSESEFYFYEVGTSRTLRDAAWLELVHTLAAGDRYIIELSYKEVSDAGNETELNAGVSVRMYETPYTASQTGDALNEQIRITTTSDVRPEIQTIVFSDTWGEDSSYTTATQQFILERTSASNLQPRECKFRLGINNVFSDYISINADLTTVKAELLKIPEMFNSDDMRSERLAGTEVTFLADSFTDYRVQYDFVFSSRGVFSKFPLVQMVQDDRSACVVTWRYVEHTDGTAKGTYVTPKYGNKKGKPVKFDGTENIANKLKASLDAIFTVDCPDDSIMPKQHGDFETEFTTNYYGRQSKEVMPFCGVYSAKNPNFLFNGNWMTDEDGENGRWQNRISRSTPVLCFAYKGDPLDSIQIRHTDSLDEGGSHDTIPISMTYSSNFKFLCIDLEDYLGDRLNEYIVHIRIWNYRSEIGYDLSITENNLFIDTVMFLAKEENLASSYLNVIDSTRSAALSGVGYSWSMRNELADGDWVADSIAVSRGASNYEYSVTMETLECAYPIALFQFDAIGNGMDYYPADNTVTITREQSATPPITGYFGLTFTGPDPLLHRTSSLIPADADEDEMKYRFESLVPTMGLVSVSRGGTCHGYRWDVEFTSEGGDKPDVSVSVNNLQPTDPSLAVDVTATVNEDGGINWDPLRSDQLRTLHDFNQVTLRINDVLSYCAAGDCAFSWNDNSPTMTSISPTQGAAGTSLNIQGTGLSSTQSDNRVYLSGVECTVTAASTTSITCSVGEGTGANHEVVVSVLGSGVATPVGGPFEFTYIEGYSSISPLPHTGSTAGGYRATVVGSAFGPETMVSFGSHSADEQCQISSVSYDEIICDMPPHAAGAVDISIGSATPTVSFTYSTLSATVSSVEPTSVNVDGSTYVTITGTGFPVGSAQVYIGGIESSDIASNTDTEILARVPANIQGEYDVNVKVGDSGYANGDEIVTYEFEVTDVSPRAASLLGGVELTITGAGFSTDTDAYTVTVGDRVCYVQSVNIPGTEIVCELYSMTDVVHLEPSSLVQSTAVQVGDFVTWSWDGITATRVFQTASNGLPMAGGFEYAESSTTGYLVHWFTEVGTYYYSSTYYSPSSPPFLGSVTVTERADHLQHVSISINGIEAQYDTSSASTGAPACGGVAGTCCDSLAFTDQSIFQMKFCDCLTPRVTSVDGGLGVSGLASANHFITVTGTGFGMGEESCEGVVLVGKNVLANHVCAVNDATYTSTNMECRISDFADNDCVRTDLPMDVDVWVKNRGYALPTQSLATSRQVTFRRSYTGLSHNTGSTVGGQMLTLSGAGFCCGNCPDVDDDSDDEGAERRRRLSDGGVMGPNNVGAGPVASSDSCNPAIPGDCTTSGAAATVDYSASDVCQYWTIAVIDDNTEECVSNGDTAMLPFCDAEDSADCQLTTGPSSTPTITAFSPTSISEADSELTITGTLFDSEAENVQVMIGAHECIVVSASDTQIVCNVGQPPVGTHALYVTVAALGRTGAYALQVNRVIDSVTPTTIGTGGGSRLIITGVGFVAGETQVSLGNTDCDVISVTGSEIIATAPALAAGGYALQVRVLSVNNYPDEAVTVDAAEDPVVSAISPASGRAGGDITISGDFEPPSVGRRKRTVDIDVTVMIGDVECVVTASSASEIVCTPGANSAGTYDITVTSQPGGAVISADAFTHLFAPVSVTPSAGDPAGGDTVIIDGSGFVDGATSVTVCGNTCSITDVTETLITCTTGANGGSEQCTVSVTVNGDTVDMDNAFTYMSAVVDDVFPPFGLTEGGTTVTITGSDFSAVVVMIGELECPVQTQSSTEIVCVTQAHEINAVPASEKYVVRVLIAGSLEAAHSDSGPHTFDYVFAWSNPNIWDGQVPGPEDFAVIPDTMGVVLDDTSGMDEGALNILMIRGGRLYFDYGATLHLKAQVIFITEGGLFQVGTEARPFTGNAIIELYGHVRSIELPIYGTKCIALRDGTLDLHGEDVATPWSLLATNANAGASQITVQDALDWSINSQIVIASTGLENSQGENEERTITGVTPAAGGQTVLSLDTPLEFSHLGTTIDLDGESMDVRAEVGLLSRNLIFRGNVNSGWDDEIEACPDGFDSGEFSTQTCFQGRHGEEIGSDEFGAHIIMHGPEKYYMDGTTDRRVTGRFSNVELTFVGQAFRLGRYAIHFHLNGDMDNSYVKKCAIHKSFNRAVNIHGSNYVLIEQNVAYDIMGGAFFLEDGIEVHNEFSQNVAIFVKSSTSLQNDDITPAAFWVTNGLNIYRNNRAAGGTHFGFWYRMHETPDASSAAEFAGQNPRLSPMGVFEDNVVHSQGWFGIWIFQVWTPMTIDDTTVPQPAIFNGMDAWNNEKCAEWVGGGAIQFTRFRCVNNQVAGVEMKLMMADTYEPYSITHGPAVRNSIFKAYDATLGDNGVTTTAVVLPMSFGLWLEDLKFINYDRSNTWVYTVAEIQGVVAENGGGYSYNARTQTFVNVNSEQKFKWNWLHHGVMVDTDGSIINGDYVDDSTSVSDFAGYSILPYNGLLPVSPGAGCQRVTSTASYAFPTAICDSTFTFRRFSFNQYDPDTLEGKYAVFANEHGSAVGHWKFKRVTHGFGWMVMLAVDSTYDFTFQDAEHYTNISYSGVFYGIEEDEYIIIQHPMPQRVDHVQTIPRQAPAAINITAFDLEDPMTGYMGASYYVDGEDAETAGGDIVYLVSARNNYTIDDNGDRVAGELEAGDKAVQIKMYQCFYANCIPPPDANTGPPVRDRQDYWVLWSEAGIWQYYDDDHVNVFVANQTEEPVADMPNSGVPIEVTNPSRGDVITDIIIMAGTWVVLDTTDLPEFRNIYLYGVLEVPHDSADALEITARSVHIIGGRLIVGWPDDPDDQVPASQEPRRRESDFVINLKATPDDEEIRSATISVGQKGIGVFGGIDMHGVEPVVTWTSLYDPAAIADTEITVIADVANSQGTEGAFSYKRPWRTGDEIVIATTSFQVLHSEVRTITGLNWDGTRTRITLNQALEHKHIAVTEEINSQTNEMFEMRAEVGLLTHNVAVRGVRDPDNRMGEVGFGGRVVVGRAANTIDPITGDPLEETMTYNGFGRFSNVQFENMGQYGFVESYDPRAALVFKDLEIEEYQLVRPSFATGCSFKNNYNAALGVFQSILISLDNNVIYQTVGSSLRMVGDSAGNSITDNLVLELINPATWQGRSETTLSWTALVDITEMNPDNSAITFTGNHVAGSERGGYRTDGYRCGPANEDNTWADNHVHSTLEGVFMFPLGSDGLSPCTVIDGFKVWRSYDFGIYIENPGKVQIKNIISVENRIGLYPMVFGSSALSHDLRDNTIQMSDSIFKGQSSVFDCEDDITNSRFLQFSSNVRGFWRPAITNNDAYSGRDRGGMSGVAWPSFNGADNAAPVMPAETIMSYQSIRGKMTITNSHFEGFGRASTDPSSSCAAYINSAFVTPTGNEDCVHPMHLEDTTVANTLDDSKIYIFRPSLSKVNPSDCVDMDCDAKKKALLVDETGDFLGSAGMSVIPEAQWSWDVASLAAHGTGMYRVPNTMLTTVEGVRIPDENITADGNQGIIRGSADDCTRIQKWNGYLCNGNLEYHMLQVESMDHDTEIRRVSPVSVFSLPLDANYGQHDPSLSYLDLVNGPQDHGWCMGYTCQKRLSVFPTLLANDYKYEIHFTGTTPQHTRLHWLNAGAADKVVVGIWYAQRWRLYVNAIKLNDDSGLSVVVDDLDLVDSYPTIDDPVGTYRFDASYQTLWIVVGGTDEENVYQYIDIRTDPDVIYVSMDIPEMSEEEFFGERIVENFAAYFGISDDHIRVASFQASNAKRDATVTVWLEISNPSDTPSADDMTSEEVAALNNLIFETYQQGILDDVIGVDILRFGIVEPLPGTDTENWQVYAELEMSGEVDLLIPETFEMVEEPEIIHEGVPFSVQPSVHALTALGERVEQLGSVFDSWNITAELVAIDSLYAEAELLGTVSIKQWNGTFNFTDLSVSHAGVYKIRFEVTYPDAVAGLFSCESEQFTVDNRRIAMDFVSGYMNVTEGVPFNVTVQMVDAYSGEQIEDIEWRGHTWEVHVSLYELHGNRGELTAPVAIATVDPSDGTASIEGLVIDAYGRYFLEFRLVSSPVDFDMSEPTRSYIDVYPAGYMEPNPDFESRIRLRFKGDFAGVADMTDYFSAIVYNVLVDDFFGDVSFTEFDVYEGSVVVEFDVQGDEADIDDFIAELYAMVTDSLTVTFNGTDYETYSELYVDDEEYTEEEKEKKTSDDGIPVWAIILIAMAVGVVIVLLLAFILYRYYFSKKWQYATNSQLVGPEKKKRLNRRDTVMMSGEDHEHFYPVKGTGPDGDNVVIPSAAPLATSFNFTEIRPNTGYKPPGRLPPMPNE